MRSGQRLPITLRPNINPRSFAPDENRCQLPPGTSSGIRSDHGSTVRCRFRPFPARDNGIPHMVYLPVDSLPEQLLVRVDITYRDARNGQEVTRIGGRPLRNSVSLIEASGGRKAFDDRLYGQNLILRRDTTAPTIAPTPPTGTRPTATPATAIRSRTWW